MTLRDQLLLAALGASLLSAPAFAQGAGSPNYSLPGTGADDTTGTLPPGSVGSYGAPPPGYSDPYARPQAGSSGDAVERTNLAPPSGYEQATTGAPASQGTYSQGTYQQSPYPQGSYPQAAAPQPAPAQGGYPQGGQPMQVTPQGSYEQANYNYRQAPDQGYGQQAPYGQQESYGQQGYDAAGQQAVTPPAGVYESNASVVPGTQEAPSGPRIENVDPTEPVAERFRRQTVDYVTTQPAGTIVIDTPNTYLYYVLGNGKAVRYGIGVGREGFTWAGTEKITGKKEWADWRPPSEMIQRQPYLPRFMAGGPGNPLGARTMYLGGTVYRIHGTNEPQTIGKFVSSGCFRMLNNDVEDLYDRVKVGTKVVILPKPVSNVQASASGQAPAPVAPSPAAQR